MYLVRHMRGTAAKLGLRDSKVFRESPVYQMNWKARSKLC